MCLDWPVAEMAEGAGMTVSEVIAAYGALVERAVAVLEVHGRRCPGLDGPVRLEVEGDQVVVGWEGYGFGEVETEKEPVPLAVLELDEGAFRAWVERERRRRDEMLQAGMRARARLHEAAAEAQERALWERLRVKYGEKG